MVTLCNSCEQQESCKTAQNNNIKNIKVIACERYFQTRRETVRGKQTNGDRIRAMTDEELAEMLCSGTCKYCHSYNKDCDILEWLRKEAEDGHK